MRKARSIIYIYIYLYYIYIVWSHLCNLSQPKFLHMCLNVYARLWNMMNSKLYWLPPRTMDVRGGGEMGREYYTLFIYFGMFFIYYYKAHDFFLKKDKTCKCTKTSLSFFWLLTLYLQCSKLLPTRERTRNLRKRLGLEVTTHGYKEV